MNAGAEAYGVVPTTCRWPPRIFPEPPPVLRLLLGARTGKKGWCSEQQDDGKQDVHYRNQDYQKAPAAQELQRYNGQGN